MQSVHCCGRFHCQEHLYWRWVYPVRFCPLFPMVTGLEYSACSQRPRSIRVRVADNRTEAPDLTSKLIYVIFQPYSLHIAHGQYTVINWCLIPPSCVIFSMWTTSFVVCPCNGDGSGRDILYPVLETIQSRHACTNSCSSCVCVFHQNIFYTLLFMTTFPLCPPDPQWTLTKIHLQMFRTVKDLYPIIPSPYSIASYSHFLFLFTFFVSTTIISSSSVVSSSP